MTRGQAPASPYRSIVPVLVTPRLELRGHRPEDLCDCLAMWSDPAVTHYVGGRALSEEEVWARILRYVGHWAVLGFGYWAIVERASGRFVGEVGLGDGHREIEPSWGRTPEAGWALASWAHGKGMASEAIAAVLAWADDNLPSSRTVCMIEPANAASLRVAGKHGYRPYVHTHYKGDPMILLERR